MNYKDTTSRAINHVFGKNDENAVHSGEGNAAEWNGLIFREQARWPFKLTATVAVLLLLV